MDFFDTCVVDATERALAAAVDLTVADAGAVQALRELAQRIDEGEARDNVSLPTYLKYCHALGLTPESRKSRVADEDKKGASLSKFRVVRG